MIEMGVKSIHHSESCNSGFLFWLSHERQSIAMQRLVDFSSIITQWYVTMQQYQSEQYVTTQLYFNALLAGSVHTQQSVAMQRMTQLWSNQNGFQWVGPEPTKGIHRPSLPEVQWAVISYLWPVTYCKSCGVNKGFCVSLTTTSTQCYTRTIISDTRGYLSQTKE
jgi:hypothetical protein